jgi:hypothetical protein
MELTPIIPRINKWSFRRSIVYLNYLTCNSINRYEFFLIPLCGFIFYLNGLYFLDIQIIKCIVLIMYFLLSFFLLFSHYVEKINKMTSYNNKCGSCDNYCHVGIKLIDESESKCKCGNKPHPKNTSVVGYYNGIVDELKPFQVIDHYEKVPVEHDVIDYYEDYEEYGIITNEIKIEYYTDYKNVTRSVQVPYDETYREQSGNTPYYNYRTVRKYKTETKYERIPYQAERRISTPVYGMVKKQKPIYKKEIKMEDRPVYRTEMKAVKVNKKLYGSFICPEDNLCIRKYKCEICECKYCNEYRYISFKDLYRIFIIIFLGGFVYGIFHLF